MLKLPISTFIKILPSHWRRQAKSFTRFLPLVVLILGIGLAISQAVIWQNKINQKADTEFQLNVERTSNEINRRFAGASTGMHTVNGLFVASEKVDRAEFRAFVQSLYLPNKLQGVHSVGFIQRVARPKLDAFVATERANGAPQFAIRQLMDKALEDLYIVKFDVPANIKDGIEGMDEGSEPRRRTAAKLAVDTGEITFTVVPELQQGEPNIPGILMYFPVYAPAARLGSAQERRAALQGLIYTSIVIADLLESMPSVVEKYLNFELFDKTPDRPDTGSIHDTNQHAAPNGLGKKASVVPRFTSNHSLVLNGGSLILHATSTPEFEATIDRTTSWVVMAAGTLVSVLLALLLHKQITGRSRAEALATRMTQELRLQEERWRDFSNSASDWFWETDAQHHFCFISENFEQVCSIHQAQLLGKSRSELLALEVLNPPEIVSAHLAQLEAHVPFKNFEFQIRANDDRLCWVSVSGQPHLDKDGIFRGYRGIGALINARKQAEQQLATEVFLREEAESLKNVWFRLQSTALEVCANAMLIVDIEGVVQWVNPAFCELSGYEAAEVVGSNSCTLFKSDAQDQDFYQQMWSSVTAGTPWKNELINRQKDGTLYNEEMTITPVKDLHGVVTHFIVVKQDITAHKQIEEAAKAGSRAKSEFLANMSHEIRTPLNGVIGMVDVLQQSRLEPMQQRMLNTIQTSSTILLNILNDILDFSKIEAGKLTLEFLPTALRQLTEGVALLMAPTASAKSIKLTVFVSPALPNWIVTDPTRLRQILINLMGNAVKFTSKKDWHPASVKMFAEPCELSSGRAGVRLRVSDTGIGMSPASQVHLFQPFTQADESTARKFGGTGLGLSICQRLVELLEGRISVSSILGEGSDFTVELPLEEPPPTRMPVFGPNLEGVRVLTLIEDPVLAGIVSSYCRNAGAEVLALADRAALNQRLAQQRFATGSGGVLVGDDLDAVLRERSLAGGLGLVCLTQSTQETTAHEVSVNAYPLIYNDLIRAIALTSGRLTLSTFPSTSRFGEKSLRTTSSNAQTVVYQPLILLAEDNETNREVMTEQLRLLGYASEVAEDGVQALAMWRSGHYALLLTDCHMPNMDGFELTEAIRLAEPSGQRIPIVAITANAMQDVADRCLSRGMDDYLSKPLRMADLAPMLNKWLPLQMLQSQDIAPLPNQEKSPDLLAIWDAATLGSLVGVNPAIQHSLLRKYLINAEQQVADIILAAEAGEYSAASDVAHALKSSSRSVGALLVGELCQEIERSGQSGDAAQCSALSGHLNIAFTNARFEIEQHIECVSK